MLEKTEDGALTVRSKEFGVTYHSTHGAIQETQTVFIDAGLKYRAQQSNKIAVLGIGFGTGLNALMTYLHSLKEGLELEYIGVEAYPIDMEVVKQLNYLDLLGAEPYEQDFIAMHSHSNKTIQLSPKFSFQKKIAKFEDLNYKGQFDIIYYDAFAPNAQPHLWEPPMLHKMYNALKKDGVLVTYCAKGVFKRTLKSLGFSVEGLPGPIGKREMTRAIK
ncbi:MAG: tRNA (5-methylaminomethyl-2-thiouridine)(34)-methyltransferase MnmD [Aureispira sp.]|nr:tRNA (5-methylaminomethyl-2-thiouridine)(34)-methyltransferase MnmD [Aureispira sp.]